VGNPGLNYTQVPLLFAEQQGFIAKHGIRITQASFQGGPPMAAALISGSLDTAVLSPAIIGNAVQHGNQLAFFCGVALSQSLAMLVQPSSPLQTVAQLGSWQAVLRQFKGLTIGNAIPGGDAQLRMMNAFTQAGVNPSSVTFVTTGIGPPAAAAFSKGQVAVFPAGDFQFEQLVGAGQAKSLLNLNYSDGPDLFKKGYAYGYASTPSWIRSHAKVASDFCAAIQDGISFLQSPANDGAWSTMLQQTFSFTPGAVPSASQVKNYYSTELPQQNIDATIQSLVQFKELQSSPAVGYNEIVVKPGA
jgi:NitT/TauT family transport system substrate-binding protein